MLLRSDIEAMDLPTILYISSGECATDGQRVSKRRNFSVGGCYDI